MENNFELPDDIKRTLIRYYAKNLNTDNGNLEKVLERGSESQNKRREVNRKSPVHLNENSLLRNIENSANMAQKKRNRKNLNLRKIVIQNDIYDDDTVVEDSPLPLIENVYEENKKVINNKHGKKYNPSYVPEDVSQQDIKNHLFQDFIIVNLESWGEMINHNFTTVKNISNKELIYSIKQILNIFAVVSIINPSVYKDFYEKVKKAYPKLKRELEEYDNLKDLLEKYKNEWFENGLILSENDKNVYHHVLELNL